MGTANANEPNGKGLTANQKRFVEEYCIHRNGTKAYFAAFGRTNKHGKKRTYRGSRNAASRLLANANMQAEIEACLKEHAKACRVSAQRVLRKLADEAFEDRTDAFDDDWRPRKKSEMPARLRHIIEGVEVKRRVISGGGEEVYEVEEVKIKFPSRDAALDKLMKHLGLSGDGSALEKLIVAITSGKGTEAHTPAIAACAGDTIADAESV